MGVADKVVAAFQSNEERARGELARLRDARERLGVQRANAERELNRLQDELPGIELARLLDDGPTSEAHRDKMARLQSAIQGLNTALLMLVPRIRRALEALRDARAQTFVRQADDIGKQHAKLNARVGAAMKELEAVAECEFVPAAAHQGALSLLGPFGVFQSGVPKLARVPKLDLLKRDESNLRGQALELTNRAIRDSGQVKADNVEALLAEVAEKCAVDNYAIGPCASELALFFSSERIGAAQAAWDKAYEQHLNAPRPDTFACESALHFECAWKFGILDAAASRVIVETLPQGRRLTHHGAIAS